MTNPTTTAQQIRAILASTGTTQTALAAAYGCRDGAMSQFLSGKRPIPDLPRMVRALSQVTGGIVHVEVEILARDGELRHNETLVTQYDPGPEDDQ